MEKKNLFIHTVFAAHYAYAVYIYFVGLDPPKKLLAIRTSFGGPFKYLTCWDLLFQTIYFFLAILNDLVGTNTIEYSKQSKVQKIRDLFFSTIAFSTAALVSITFWTLYAINRELIFPKVLDSFFPVWLNHSIHTAPVVCALIEMWMCPHTYPSQRKAFAIVTTEVVVYCLWVCVIASQTGFWVYPILQKLTTIGRAAFISGMAILAFVFFLGGDQTNRLFWRSHKAKRSKKMK